MGVHAAIEVEDATGDLPVYVQRDTDVDQRGVRAKIGAAAERAGFVLLVGGSSVGKTRCAYEAIRALLPDWWLVQAADPADPVEIRALAEDPTPRTVVWLDELQRHLGGANALTAGTIRALLMAPAPVVLVGTLWPEWYTAYTARPDLGEQDPYRREREVLELAEVVRVNARFSSAELARAEDAAAEDDRIRAALTVSDYGLTQALAAAPQLVSR